MGVIESSGYGQRGPEDPTPVDVALGPNGTTRTALRTNAEGELLVAGIASGGPGGVVQIDPSQWSPLLAALASIAASNSSGGGQPGAPGESAYQIALRLDPTIGTEAEWITSLEDDEDHRWVSGTGPPMAPMEPGTFYLDIVSSRVYESVED